MAARADAAPHGLQRATTRAEGPRQRGASPLQAALEAPHARSTPARQLTQGKRRSPCTMVQAYARTMAPILTGQSHCPAPLGRTTGRRSAPTTGLLCAIRGPAGPPSAPRAVLPRLDKAQRAIDRLSLPRRRAMPAVAGDRGRNDPALRQPLQARGMRTGGLPQTSAPMAPCPPQDEVLQIRNEAGVQSKRPPHQVPLAAACGSRRPVVDRPIARVLARGAGQRRDKGLEGAVVPWGMTAMAHNSAAMVRIRQRRLAQRAQKCRRWLGWRSRNVNQIKDAKN